MDSLSAQTGISFSEVCDYAGLCYNEEGASFYVKVPKRRRTFIGIGMAFGQPLEVINDWITTFGGGRRLYAKDISEDLVWMYLIAAAHADAEAVTHRNYYRLYDACQEAAFATWQQMWDEITIGSLQTADVEIQLEEVAYDDEFKGLRDFIIDHMDSFKTAYMRPRVYLSRYVEQILATCREHADRMGVQSLSDLRGWLDDSMINYLAADPQAVNVIDQKSRRRTVRIKYLPKNKRTHISLCLALGMSREQIDEYLDLMGYLPLDEMVADERKLIERLDEWNERYPLSQMYRRQYFDDHYSDENDGGERLLTPEKELQAVEEMLTLRQSLRTSYKMQGESFPYLKWTHD